MHQYGLAAGATFLSLDVEGAEALVLRSVDPTNFRVILVEWTTDGAQDKAKNEEVHKILIRAGMALWGELRRGNKRVQTIGGGTNRVYVTRQGEGLQKYQSSIMAVLPEAINE